MVLPSDKVVSCVTVTIAVIGAPVTTLCPRPTSSWKNAPPMPPAGSCIVNSILPGGGGMGGPGSDCANASDDNAAISSAAINHLDMAPITTVLLIGSPSLADSVVQP